ncbi:serine hydrolase domain-containing protein [Salinimicrobium catena]|uniref:serine hydrolase domain-containing protein n=1 Tax=Salinimicrobium catena TaxID=390640 RepID=UPI002FE43C3B
MRIINFLIIFFLFSSGYAQKLTERIDLLVQEHHASYPNVGLVVSASKAEEVVFEDAYGYSNREFQVKAQPQHKFRIGSLTKQFTAVAILKLMEEGKLSLNDPLQKYLPGFPSEIKLEHLLTHTSGLMDYGNKPDWFPKVSKQDLEPEALAEYIKNDPLQFAPGSRFEYNNTGYHLLGLIIEKLSKKSYEEYLRDEIFEPLEMNDSFAHSSNEVVADMAEGYEVINRKAYAPEFIHPKQPFAAGNIVSTAADLRKWYSGLYSGKIIKPETLEKALTPYTLNDSTKTKYGLGWQVDNLQGLQVVNHGSYYPGYTAEAWYFPETEVLVTAFSNSMPLTNMVKKIGLIANSKPLEKKEFLQLSHKELLPLNATYQKDNDQWKFQVIENKIYYSRNNSSRYEIKPVKKDLFYSLDWDIFLEFKDAENGVYQTYVFHWNGTETEYSLVSEEKTSLY